MCCPEDSFRPKRADKYLGHRLVSQKFANYITRSPVLNRRTSRHPTLSPDPAEDPLDLYIARVIHAAKVPDIVPYAALYLLASISQTCQCKVPHDENKLNYDLSSPSKLSHFVSRAMTRTPFSRIVKPHWNERHIFIGAFYPAILAYRPVFYDEFHKELPYQSMRAVCGIEEEEIGELSAAFKQCITYELQTAIDLMLYDKLVINVSEFDCPFATARQRQLTKSGDESESDDEKSPKKRMGLKRSISSFWKPKEKATPVESPEPERQWSVDCGPNTGSADSYYYP